MDSIEQITRDYYASLYAKDLASERFLGLPQEEQERLTAQAMERTKALVDKTLTRLQERDIGLLLNGTFHPDNRFSRRIFALVTGQELPRTVADTRAMVLAYIGQEKLDAHNQEKERQEQERLDKIRAADNERCAKIVARIRAGESVSGEELADAAQFAGVTIHPRTIGTLRKRVVSINADGAKIYRTKTGAKSALSNEPYRVYQQIQEGNHATV